MTSISSTQFVHNSPRSMMDARISSAVAAGSISTEDQTALENALDSIDSSLAASRSSGTRPSGDMKTRMDSLIDQQVEAGALTDDQATELKAFFAEGPGAAGGARGPGGPGGPPPPSGSASADEDDTTSAAEEATKQIDALMAFLEQLRASLSTGLYGQASTDTSSHSGLVVDTNA